MATAKRLRPIMQEGFERVQVARMTTDGTFELHVVGGGWPAMERVVTVEDHPVRYLSAGTGPELVLLHGLGESPADWAAVLPRLAASRAVYAPALPGFDGHGGPG